MKWNGHTHGPFCRHGSTAGQSNYVEQAVKLGFERYTISEHPPLPAGWIDNPQLMQELAMLPSELTDYFAMVEEVKKQYDNRLDVAIGLEMDYLHGNTSFSESMIDRHIKQLEDFVVSVHYLPGKGGMRSIDFTPGDFQEGLLSYYGSMDVLVEEYFDHVEQAIEWAGTLPGRKRLGHILLIEKFRTELPEIPEEQIRNRLDRVLPLLKEKQVALDVNTAGLRVKTCGRPYVPEWFLHKCRQEGISCVFGSDAHKPEDAGAGWEWFEETVR